ncbi:MAG: ABC transporter permease, partial [Acidimicrobiia bacterium]
MTDRPKAASAKIQQLDAIARDPEQLLDEPTSVWRLILRRFLSRKISIAGMILVGMMTLVAIFAPVIAPYDPYEVLIGKEDVSRFEAPCVHLLGCDPANPQHILGVDGNVRDQFSRIIYGSRVSLTLGISTVTIAILIGARIGAVAGY